MNNPDQLSFPPKAGDYRQNLGVVFTTGHVSNCLTAVVTLAVDFEHWPNTEFHEIHFMNDVPLNVTTRSSWLRRGYKPKPDAKPYSIVKRRSPKTYQDVETFSVWDCEELRGQKAADRRKAYQTAVRTLAPFFNQGQATQLRATTSQ